MVAGECGFESRPGYSFRKTSLTVKLQIASDMHLEFYAGNTPKALRIINQMPHLADTLILAGDICSLARIEASEVLLRAFCDKWKNVLYVPGNHEFYGTSIEKGHQALEQLTLELDNLHWLRPQAVVWLGDRRFIGDTLWFADGPMNWHYGKQMNDFRQILDARMAYDRNTEARGWFEQELAPGDIVVTHHLPSYALVQDLYKGDPLNVFYANNLDSLIADRKPALWVHGHTHVHHDRVLGETRVVANAKGYPHETLATWDKGMAVEV